MKEFKNVKRLSIGPAIFILALIIAFLSYERSENLYAMDAASTLESLTTRNYVISIEDSKQSGVVLVDIRNPYEFENSHLENAINIPTPDILKEENQTIFKEWKESNKTVTLYGKDIEEANIPFLLLYQLGYDNLKLLNAENRCVQNKLRTDPTNLEKPIANIRAFIDESIRKSKIKKVVKKERKPVPKKIVPVKKKKKKPIEGGC
ncbi:MAG TPA: rhodanese-like domain-containing protein [Salegentibacter sp.]|uniref:rhodanese-like domain-containing protein n=1 Tax=Salegentibacter sp. TaxID=1903072 RepID=UPI002F93224A